MMETVKLWSPQQDALFHWTAHGKGNAVVGALAGTGKTTSMVECCVRAAREPRILFCAFNVKIKQAAEAKLSAARVKNVDCKTMHGVGNTFLRQAGWRIVGDPTDRVDFDRARDAVGHNAPDEVVALVKDLASKLKACAPFTWDVAEVIAVAGRFDLTPSGEMEEAGYDMERLARCAGKARDAAMVPDPQGRISFDDMIYIPLANGFVKPRYSLVIVDEAQDMNVAQLLLAQDACAKGGRIMVVGDKHQAIYGFRGADSGSMDRLAAELKAEALGLTVTYRCGKAIVREAQRFVPHFEAHHTNPEGIVDTAAVSSVFESAKAGDFVLSRKNAPLMGLCLGFLKRGIRARIVGRDIAKMLRDIVGKFNAKSVPDYLAKVAKYAERQAKRLGKLADAEVRDAKLSDLADTVEILTTIATDCVNVAAILERCNTLFLDEKNVNDAAHNEVILSSVHKSKGLEARHVFVLLDGLSTRDEEEKNIWYVAATRAIEHLTYLK